MNRTTKTLGTLLLATLPLAGCGRTEYRYDPDATVHTTCTMDHTRHKHHHYRLDCGENGEFRMSGSENYHKFAEGQQVHATIERGYAIHYDSDEKETSRKPFARVTEIQP